MQLSNDQHRSNPWLALVEGATYLVVVGSFLTAYVGIYRAPPDVIHHHLYLVALILATPIIMRALLWKFAPPGHLRNGMLCMLTLAPITLLAAWSMVALAGLDAWGRLTTWPLIRTYIIQAPDLLRVLGIPPWIPATLTLGVASAVFLFVWRYFTPRDWTRIFAETGTRRGLATISAGAVLICAMQLHGLVSRGGTHPMEPLAQSLIATRSNFMQSHHVAGSSLLDGLESDARNSYKPVEASRHRNLVVIIGDALRSDHMSIYDYPRATTPNLLALSTRHETKIVRNARAACAESACGLMAFASSRPVYKLPSRPITLQEILRLNAYKAHFILGGDHTNFYGLDQMYGELDSFHDGSKQSLRYVNDDQLVIDALEDFPSAIPGQPTAFQFHLMSTHGLGSRDPEMSPFSPSSNYYAWPSKSPRRPPNAIEAQRGVNHYDNGVVRFDHTVATILEMLGNKGYLEDALVVITGDHGEMLGEHGYFAHQFSLHESVLSIPFVLIRFGYTGDEIRNNSIVGQIDMSPTILHELDLPIPDIWEGRPLQYPPIERELHIQQSWNFGIYHIDNSGNALKYWRDMKSGVESVTNPLTDPLGKTNLIESTPTYFLESWRKQSTAGMFTASKDGDR